ncbi:hypothetical protein SDC9_57235 [bioreactor metagenome]|uniref:Uncharacterized protein n=1 Tax=bioreactor metagenome TaxID=1076179 RepID=A0A644X518_9ZZZZ
MNIDYEELRMYKDRIRIFFIIYFFSEPYNGQQYSDCCRVLHTEVKIQKLDFLIRNPDYLCYELLDICNRENVKKEEIKTIIKNIFHSKEPQIRRLEMEKFFFGAYEDIDQVIAFLVAVGFIKYTTERNSILRPIEKNYYVTNEADQKMKKNMNEMPYLRWYVDRCLLIKKYFGEYSGTELKNLQYKIDEYRNTTYKEYIRDVAETVKIKYFEDFGEEL